MGCGMSRSNLMDDFGSRSPFHHKPDTAPPPKLLMNYDESSQPPIVHQPPLLQKINTTQEVNHDDDGRMISTSNGAADPMWFGSPSFREYVQSGPDNVATTGNHEHGGEAIVGTHGGQNLTCNREVCVWGDSKEKTQEVDRKDTRGGRFRKVFQVHRVTLWHGGAWHAGHPKATRKAI